jgi:glucokinase
MILAGDVGGTNTRLAFFEPQDGGLAERWSRTFPSREAAGLAELVRLARDESGLAVQALCVGIAGPVEDGRCAATNLPWCVDARELARGFGLRACLLLNDLEASAWGLATLSARELRTLLPGEPHAGNAGLLAAGTGLGQAGLLWDGARHRPFACEGGHVDFAPGDELETRLLRWLRARHGHVSFERVLSGPGLANVHAFLRDESRAAGETGAPADDPATIARAAGHGEPLAVEALTTFVRIYGRAAGNVALVYLARAGVYLAGGIAPKILPWLERPEFRAAFLAKGRLSGWLERVPVRVVLEDRAAVFGAARAAALELGISDGEACRILRA